MKNNKSNVTKIIITILSIIVVVACLFMFKSCSKKDEQVSNEETTEVIVVEEPTKTQETKVEEETEEVVEELKEEEKVEELVKDNSNYSYYVNFLNKDGSLLQRSIYKYGETPIYKGVTPEYSDNSYYYSFTGWDKKLSKVTGTQTYTALYDIVGTINNNSNDKAKEPEVLTFTAEEDNSKILLTAASPDEDVKLQYSINGKEWQDYEIVKFDQNAINSFETLQKGDTIRFKATTINTHFSSESDNWYFFIMDDDGDKANGGKWSASGDVTSLLNGVGGDLDLLNTNNSSDYSGCFHYLFDGCDTLISAPNLPSITLADSCYVHMFRNCTSLTTAPALPATTLANSCYESMFEGCTSLTSAPALPATTLAANCYQQMFYGCASLTTAPALLATTLADNCYHYMFYDCNSLTLTTSKPLDNEDFDYGVIANGAKTLGINSASDMFKNCNKGSDVADTPEFSTGTTYYWRNYKEITLAPATFSGLVIDSSTSTSTFNLKGKTWEDVIDELNEFTINVNVHSDTYNIEFSIDEGVVVVLLTNINNPLDILEGFVLKSDVNDISQAFGSCVTTNDLLKDGTYYFFGISM